MSARPTPNASFPDKPKETPEENDECEQRERNQQAADAVAAYVLREIGKPPRFAKIDGHYLYDDRYRVNVWVHEDCPNGGETLKMSDSFFVAASSGRLVKSVPPITRKYH